MDPAILKERAQALRNARRSLDVTLFGSFHDEGEQLLENARAALHAEGFVGAFDLQSALATYQPPQLDVQLACQNAGLTNPTPDQLVDVEALLRSRHYAQQSTVAVFIFYPGPADPVGEVNQSTLQEFTLRAEYHHTHGHPYSIGQSIVLIPDGMPERTLLRGAQVLLPTRAATWTDSASAIDAILDLVENIFLERAASLQFP